MIKLDLTKKGSEELIKKLKETPKNVEDDINKYLHSEGAKAVSEQIIGFTPISDRKKEHAKDNQYVTTTTSNLAVEWKTKGKFNYLVFPNSGIGVHNPVAQQFFEKGLEAEKNTLFEKILKIIEKSTER